jgi:hypothetical protein
VCVVVLDGGEEGRTVRSLALTWTLGPVVVLIINYQGGNAAASVECYYITSVTQSLALA